MDEASDADFMSLLEESAESLEEEVAELEEVRSQIKTRCDELRQRINDYRDGLHKWGSMSWTSAENAESSFMPTRAYFQIFSAASDEQLDLVRFTSEYLLGIVEFTRENIDGEASSAGPNLNLKFTYRDELAPEVLAATQVVIPGYRGDFDEVFQLRATQAHNFVNMNPREKSLVSTKMMKDIWRIILEKDIVTKRYRA